MKKNFTIIISMFLFFVQLNAQTWTSLTTPSLTGVSGLAVANSKLYMSATNGVYSTTDGVTWDSTFNGMTATAGFTFSANIYNYNDVLYSGAKGAVYKSVDYGANWTKVTGAEPSTTADNATVFKSGDTIIGGWAGNAGIRTTVDGGANWTNTASFSQSISQNVVMLNGAVYVKTLTGVYKSTDLAATFTQLSGGLPTISGSVGALTVSNGVLICAIYTFGLYISSDEGVTWTQISSSAGLTSTAVGTLAKIGGVVYLGCTGGQAFMSIDNGSNWTDITGTGINGLDQIKCFAVYNGDLYAGATYALYKTPLSSFVNKNNNAEKTISVYPNPAHEKLNIVSSESFKKQEVKIFNLCGGLVEDHTFSNGESLSININILPKGLYMLEIYQDGTISRYKFVKE